MYWSLWVTETIPSETNIDLIIQGGTIVDGTGANRYLGDLAVSSGRISAITPPGQLEVGDADVFDASGRIVAPGFIDVHTHDDNAVLVNPGMTAKISQGVTTVIGGNCGISLSPIFDIDPPAPMNLLGGRDAFQFARMQDYTNAVNNAHPAVNIAALVGHSTLRVGAMDELDRKATAPEIDVMRNRLSDALDAGAIGFSTGLWYKTNFAADMDEVVALAEVMADKGGVYTTHMRNEHDAVLDSLQESFETANRAQVPVIISHHKCAGPKNWGRSHETLAMIEAARKTQNISLDAYPYCAGSTVLEPEMVDTDIRIMVTWSHAHPETAGQDLADIAHEWSCSQTDAARKLAPAGAIYFQIDEDDVRNILEYAPTMIGSDGLPHDDHPHPRLWGTFPKVLGHYCRDVGLFSLEQAVHKMTGLSARNFGLKDRGELVEGAIADIVIFDATNIRDTATFADPMQPAAGIDHVIVGGGVSWSHGEPTSNRSGKFVTRP